MENVQKDHKGTQMGKFPVYSHGLTKEGGALLLSKLVSSACEDTVISPK